MFPAKLPNCCGSGCTYSQDTRSLCVAIRKEFRQFAQAQPAQRAIVTEVDFGRIQLVVLKGQLDVVYNFDLVVV